MPNPGAELSSIDFGQMIGGPLNAVIDAQKQSAMTSVDFIKAVGFRPAESSDSHNPQVGDPVYVTFKYPKEVKPYVADTKGVIQDVSITNGGIDYQKGDVLKDTKGASFKVNSVDGKGKVTGISVSDGGSDYDLVEIQPSGGQGKDLKVKVTNNIAAGSPASYQDMKLQVPILTMLPIPFIRIEETTIEFNAKINSMQYQSASSATKVAVEGEVSYPPIKPIVKLKASVSHQKKSSSGSNVQRSYSLNIKVRAVQDEMPAGLERILSVLEDSMTSEASGVPVRRAITKPV